MNKTLFGLAMLLCILATSCQKSTTVPTKPAPATYIPRCGSDHYSDTSTVQK